MTKLERTGIILSSIFNFKSPVIIFPKKNPSAHGISYRNVVDFRKMNEQLEYLSYQLMKMDTSFSKLHGTKLFSTLDVRSNSFDITIAKDSRISTAFTTEYGQHEFLQVPLSIHVASSYIELRINETQNGLNFCFAYVDGIIMFLKSNMESLDHLFKVFNYLN